MPRYAINHGLKIRVSVVRFRDCHQISKTNRSRLVFFLPELLVFQSAVGAARSDPYMDLTTYGFKTIIHSWLGLSYFTTPLIQNSAA